MTLPLIVLVGLCTWAISAALYGLLRKHQILDIPNARSSHSLPTPKGGGIGLIAVICVYAGWLALSGTAPFPLLAIALATLALSILGLVDDLRNLAVRLRFGVQIGLALVVVALLVWPAALALPMRLALAGLATLFLLWCTNLYNFMDGIDGIACLQAILCGALIYGLHLAGLYPGQLADLALVVAICCLGFGYFNFPPAKMFMGDAGSVALGFLLASIALLEYHAHPTAFWLWLIALAGFISDASATLAVRFVSGHRVYEAHRSHLYQLYTQHQQNRLRSQGVTPDQARVGAHRTTLTAFGGVFLLWQAPISIAVAGHWLPGPLGASVALVPLTLLAVYLGAGRERIQL